MADELKPSAWLHHQGNHTEVSERPLDTDEIARGWWQEALHTADQMRAAILEERERILTLIESRRNTDEPSVNWSTRMFAYDEALTDIAALILEVGQ